MPMPSPDAQREQSRARWPVLLTTVVIVLLVAVYNQGPEWVGLVLSLGFMVGSVVERMQLSRSLVSLLNERAASPPQAGVAWSA